MVKSKKLISKKKETPTEQRPSNAKSRRKNQCQEHSDLQQTKFPKSNNKRGRKKKAPKRTRKNSLPTMDNDRKRKKGSCDIRKTRKKNEIKTIKRSRTLSSGKKANLQDIHLQKEQLSIEEENITETKVNNNNQLNQDNNNNADAEPEVNRQNKNINFTEIVVNFLNQNNNIEDENINETQVNNNVVPINNNPEIENQPANIINNANYDLGFGAQQRNEPQDMLNVAHNGNINNDNPNMNNPDNQHVPIDDEDIVIEIEVIHGLFDQFLPSTTDSN